MSIRDIIRNAIDGLGLALELWATESRIGIRRVEAYAANVFEQELQLIERDEQERQNLRQIAIDAAKLGVRLHELEPMVRLYCHADALNITPEDLIAFAKQRDND